jgi:hypothetical protein
MSATGPTAPAEVVAARREWVAALEAADRQQARGSYRQGEAFCCLGVGLDLIDPHAWEPVGRELLKVSAATVTPGWYYGPYSVSPKAGAPKVLLDVYGVTPAQSAELARRNDGLSVKEGLVTVGTGVPKYHKHSFVEIAQVLRSWFGPDFDRLA